MNIPNQIFLKECDHNRNDPRGSQLTATFQGTDFPTTVRIKGTNDVASVVLQRQPQAALQGNGRPGQSNFGGHDNDCNDHDKDHNSNCNPTSATWESKGNYKTLNQTLQFLKNNVVLQEASYDAKGKLIVQAPTATIKNFNIVSANNNTEADLQWTSVAEVQVQSYSSERQLPGTTNWQQFHSDSPLGAGTVYTTKDLNPVAGTVKYQLKALYTNNTSAVLASQALTFASADVPSAVVNNFLAAYDGTFVNLQWTSIKEVFFNCYNVERLDPGASAYAVVVSNITGQGPNNYGPFQDVPSSGPGQYSYRLVAVYTDNTSAVVATYPALTV